MLKWFILFQRIVNEYYCMKVVCDDTKGSQTKQPSFINAIENVGCIYF
jgi:hypothetical protein